jgi:hypothetical protein
MLTPEQCLAVQHFKTGEAERVVAFAGAGKTSTLVTMAKCAPNRRGFYLAFNKSIATEASLKFPRSVTCRTTHSVAFGTVVRMGFDGDRHLMNTPRSRTFDISAVLLKAKLPMHDDTFRSIVGTTITRFCQSDADEIQERHVPRVPGLSDADQEFLYRWAPIVAEQVWNRMADPSDDMPLGSDGYIKVWALSRPRIAADYIFVDEAQDLNPVLINVIRNQQAQVVAVGDGHQQIYEWRGARDALKILAGREFRLTKSFRFGAEIARAANGVLAAMGEEFPLAGFEMVKDQVTSVFAAATIDAVLCRSNAGVIESAMEYLDDGRAVYTPGGAGELRTLVEDAEALKSGRPARSASLMGFAKWKDVEDYVKTDEGASLKVFVNLVGRYGTGKLKGLLNRIDDKPTPGCVTISTAHKGKGLEWHTVKINYDFLPGDAEDDVNINMAERRLFYVAITRAKTSLVVDPYMLEAYSTANQDDDG